MSDDSDSRTDATDVSVGDATVESEPGEPRDIVVPDRAYKAVTVFSTLLAVVLVVLGFAFLDAATVQASPLGALVGVIPVTLHLDGGLLDIVAAGIGLGLIALGAWTYVVATRFRAAGMGNAQADGDQPPDNG